MTAKTPDISSLKLSDSSFFNLNYTQFMNTNQSPQTATKGGDGSNSEQRVVSPSDAFKMLQWANANGKTQCINCCWYCGPEDGLEDGEAYCARKEVAMKHGDSCVEHNEDADLIG